MKTYKDLKEWVGLNVPDTETGMSVQAVDDVDTFAPGVEDPATLDKLNFYLQNITNRQYINPYYILNLVWKKLSFIGLHFDMRTVTFMGDEGRISVPLTQYGRYGVLDTPGAFVSQDDGISNRLPGGLNLVLTFQKNGGAYTMAAQLEKGIDASPFVESASSVTEGADDYYWSKKGDMHVMRQKRYKHLLDQGKKEHPHDVMAFARTPEEKAHMHKIITGKDLKEAKSYSLTPAQSFSHVPANPDRTAHNRTTNTYKEFPHSDAMHKFLSGSNNHADTWKAWHDTPAGYRHKQGIKEDLKSHLASYGSVKEAKEKGLTASTLWKGLGGKPKDGKKPVTSHDLMKMSSPSGSPKKMKEGEAEEFQANNDAMVGMSESEDPGTQRGRYRVVSSFGGKMWSHHGTENAAHKAAKQHSHKQPVDVVSPGGPFETKELGHYVNGRNTDKMSFADHKKLVGESENKTTHMCTTCATLRGKWRLAAPPIQSAAKAANLQHKPGHCDYCQKPLNLKKK